MSTASGMEAMATADAERRRARHPPRLDVVARVCPPPSQEKQKPEGRKGFKSKKRLLSSSSAPKVPTSSSDSDMTKLTMEERLRHWKHAKKNDRQRNAGVNEALPSSVRQKSLTTHKNHRVAANGRGEIQAPAPKRIIEAPTKVITSSGSARYPIIIDMDTNRPSSKPKVLAKELTLVERDLPAAKGKKPDDSDKEAAPHIESPTEGHTSAGSARDPIIIEMDATKIPAPRSQDQSSIAKIMPLTHPGFDKENQPAPGHHNLPDPVVTTEKKPEELAKELIRAAIDFERKHRFATAYCIFKRAYQLLPKKSAERLARLSERLAHLEREHPAAANHVPPSEMSTPEFMTRVLEHDLMGVLNHGSIEELTELHAIGSKRAELVLDQRPFHQLEDLQRIPGITANVVARLHQHHTNWTSF